MSSFLKRFWVNLFDYNTVEVLRYIGVITLIWIWLIIVASLAFAEGPPGSGGGPLEGFFKNQQNSKHQLCCSIADGRILRLDQMRETDEGYEVQVPNDLDEKTTHVKHGEWLKVPPENIIHTQNPTSQPIAWFYNSEVRCFVLPPLS